MRQRVAEGPSLLYNTTVMKNSRAIARVCAKVRTDQQTSDFAYWQAQPYQVRLAALEQIRQDYHRWKYGVEPEFQRVVTVVKMGEQSDNPCD